MTARRDEADRAAIGHLARSIAIAAGLGLLVLFALTALDPERGELWLNAHWTLSSATAATLAWLGVRRGAASERGSRRLLAAGFGLYLVGQIAWLLQVVLGALTVPAPSDVFFVSSTVPIGLAFVARLWPSLSPTQRFAFGLDAAILAAVLLLVLWVVFGDSALLVDDPVFGAVLILYPVSFLLASGMGAMAALRLSIAPAWTGINALLLGVAATGVAWVVWMDHAATQLPPPNDPANFAFSIATLVAAIGAARLSFRTSDGRAFRRVALAVETMFPMLAVMASIGATLVAENLLPETADRAVQGASAIIVVLALARQSILMLERQRLADRDRRRSEDERRARAVAEEALEAHRASEARYRDVVDVFARLGEQMSFAADETTLIRGGVAALRRLVAADVGDLLLANASQDQLVVATSWGSGAPAPGEPLEGLAPVACLGIRRGSLYHVADAADELVLPCPARPRDHGSLMCVPMLALGQIIGVVHLAAELPLAFGVDDERQAQRVAEQVALAIANARLVRTMESMALTDPLTRLHNARFFDPYLDRELATSQREGDPISVIMIDLDHFKAFNDEHGHAAGDEALRAFARAALAVLRDSDTLARYGGEEFVVAVRGAALDQAVGAAERLRAAVEGTTIEVGLGRYASITASFGVASTTVHGHDRLQLLKQADRALYRAKREGRNRVVAAGAPRVNRRAGRTEIHRDEAAG